MAALAELGCLGRAYLTGEREVCGGSRGSAEPEQPYSRATPEDLIAAFSYAMEYRDIDIYAECMHPEYRFDYNGCWLPEWWQCDSYLSWDYGEDLQNTACMFGDSTVTEFVCALPIMAGPWPTEDGLGYGLEPFIKFTVESSGAGEPHTYWVFASRVYIEVAVDPSDEGLWVLRTIVEESKEGAAAGAATEPASLAAVKWMFRCDAK